MSLTLLLLLEQAVILTCLNSNLPVTNNNENKRRHTNMSEESSSLSTRMAAEIAECSARHIQSLIKKGKLSASRDDGGNYLIDKSEFYRVFPNAHMARMVTKSDEQNSRTALEVEVKYLKEMLAEKAKQNEFLHKQLEAANTEKNALLETLTSNQKLLEHTSQKKRKKFLGVF